MPREKIISGALEGEGIEGRRKKSKIPSDNSGDKSHDDPLDTGFGSSKPDRKAMGDSHISDNSDIFSTGFGSSSPKRKYSGASSVGDDSDIFSGGFGSSGGRKKTFDRIKPETENKEKHDSEELSKNTSEERAIHGGDSPGSIESEMVTKKEDPFYTGFGYTDQRNQRTIKSGKKSSEKKAGSKKDVNDADSGKSALYIDDEDDLFS
ncbi:hypothetical protein F1737_10700 [Methanoplanus sp. FWC-SCC4]|uniref:Uncharacterized protein n=1 Tax=Methanochimaera problematica TaxID=2609417 RepID=A0AA97I4N1_9EURY|nr:hypothetical protein [Methanoplanus sp. FWC-SCC4]WOF17111.1 hypothetical protein F1737_10700 [Methanoplanus sp. FWC-SCC4]